MDEQVTDRSMSTKGDDKSVETPASQVNASADSSVCDELREPSIPPVRFWTLSVGYVIVTALSADIANAPAIQESF